MESVPFLNKKLGRTGGAHLVCPFHYDVNDTQNSKAFD